jgi:hypothetical protein
MILRLPRALNKPMIAKGLLCVDFAIITRSLTHLSDWSESPLEFSGR